MKRFVTAILALLYIGTSTGATIHTHYCMGKLADWSLSDTQSKICPICGMVNEDNSDNGCCKDEHQFVKDDSVQKVTENNYQLLQLSFIAIPTIFTELPIVSISSLTEENPLSNAPPRTSGIALYIFKRSFLI